MSLTLEGTVSNEVTLNVVPVVVLPEITAVTFQTESQVVKVKEDVVLTWSVLGGAVSNAFVLEYSTDEGLTWQTIESSYVTSNNTFRWSVPNTAGNYVVRVTSANGIADTVLIQVDSKPVDPEIPASLGSNSAAKSRVTVYPTVSEGQFYVNALEAGRLQLFDVKGQLV